MLDDLTEEQVEALHDCRIPHQSLYLHPHGAANEAVTLHKGPISFPDTGKGAAEGTGTLTLRWLPSTGLRLDTELNSGHPPEPGARVKAHVADSVAETLISHMGFGVRDGASLCARPEV